MADETRLVKGTPLDGPALCQCHVRTVVVVNRDARRGCVGWATGWAMCDGECALVLALHVCLQCSCAAGRQ